MNLKNKFQKFNISEKIISIYILIYFFFVLYNFLLLPIINIFFKEIIFLKKIEYTLLIPSIFSNFCEQPWSLFTYSFVHLNMLHLLSNILFLILISRIFLNFFSWKIFLKFYFLGTSIAGLVFLIINSIWNQDLGYLYSSSTAIITLFFAVVAYQPNKFFPIPFIGNVLLKHIAFFILITDLTFLIEELNIWQYLPRLSSAITGFLYMKQIEMGRDILDFSYWIKKWKK